LKILVNKAPRGVSTARGCPTFTETTRIIFLLSASAQDRSGNETSSELAATVPSSSADMKSDRSNLTGIGTSGIARENEGE
jgi:hypothetical protein